jgi:hypothetical protein
MTILAIPTATELMAKIKPLLITANCINSNKPMIQSQEMNGSVYIYKLPVIPAVYVYTSSASIDCDGQACPECKNDPTNQGQTSFEQSDGKYLAPCLLPWYVLPETPNPIFDYAKSGIAGGQLGIVIYNGKMSYGVFGDERGRDSGNSAGKAIGEVSYKMATNLGISPDPANGGVSSGVTYIVFTTSANVVKPIESVPAAKTLGDSSLMSLWAQLNNSPVPPPIPPPTPDPTGKKFKVTKNRHDITVTKVSHGGHTATDTCKTVCDMLNTL